MKHALGTFVRNFPSPGLSPSNPDNVDDEDEIDHSLLDCNNLIRVVEFTELTAVESSDLSDHVGLNKKYKNKMRVLDIIRNNKPRETHEMGF